ncbi:MAG: zinc-binding dehydrogenase, partial [Actinomycetes bacterium]
GRSARVLVNGAGGAVGTFVCQLAVAAGALVDAVAAPADVGRLLRFGVDRVLDYHEQGTAATLRDWAGTGYDIVADLVGAGTDLAPLLGYGGTIAATLGRPDLARVAPFTISPTAVEIALGAVYQCGTNQQRQDLGVQLGRLLHEVAAGRLASPPFTVVPLADLPTIWQRKGDRSASGKLVAIL